MDRYAIFVDAGYFFAAGAQAAFGTPLPRKNIALKSPSAMVSSLCARAAAATGGLSLLRVYWYDAMPGPRLSLEQSAIAQLPGIKLRLGALNSAGEQKGVDSLIVTDIIELARNRAIADAVVVTGDEDLRIAFQLAQSFGVRVHILAAGDAAKNVSLSLQMEADSLSELDAAWFSEELEAIAPALKPVGKPVLVAPASALVSEGSEGTTAADGFEASARDVIGEMLGGMPADQLTRLKEHLSGQTTIPPEYDRPLIAQVSAQLGGRRFTGEDMRRIRGQFVRAVKDRSGSGSD